ncbi:MAG: hypothetical protein EA403_15335 [Spirochaetaceae bacterium]|nr:MAG: hypothetical protein EA403_15335 [Spirochaetaceae bacterium]
MKNNRIMPMKKAMTKRVGICILLLIGVTGAVVAQANPFTGGGAPQERTQTETADRPAHTAPMSGLISARPIFPRLNALLRDQQRTLNARVAELLRGRRMLESRAPDSAGTDAVPSRGVHGIAVIALVSLVYGLVHAALPGHRKVLLVSYFASVDAPVRHAVIAGMSVAALHSGAAAVVVLGAYYLLRTSLTAAIDQTTLYLQAATAAIVLVVGAVILVSKVREAFALRDGNHHAHDNHHDHEERAVGRLRRRIGLLPAIIVSAIVPCPGTAMILLFAVSLGVVSLGLFATLMFSIGMAVTLTAVCVAAVLTKRVVTGALDGPLGEALHVGVEGLGGLVMVAFGAATLLPLL